MDPKATEEQLGMKPVKMDKQVLEVSQGKGCASLKENMFAKVQFFVPTFI